MDNEATTNESTVETSPESHCHTGTCTHGLAVSGEKGAGKTIHVIENTDSTTTDNYRRISNGLRKLVQQLTAPGEITESERRRRRAANKRSRVSRKRNQKLARLKKGKKR